MIILQIAPVIGVGTGVGAVAYHLEQEWQRLGHDVRRLELQDTGGGWLPEPGPGVKGKLALMARVVWFSTVGTVVARRTIAALPRDAVSICHNDALAGDVYVNHGIVLAAMRARGNSALRMARNPLHLFTFARDFVRFHSRTHRLVVNLSARESEQLVQSYGAVLPQTVIVHNGVDTRSLQPVSDLEKQQLRARLSVPQDDYVCVFVGHEFNRKGLAVLCEAVSNLPGASVMVIGGDQQEIAAFKADHAASRREAVRFFGRIDDAKRVLGAADVLVLPSAYEANALIVLEAFAAGVPVIATDVGAAAELLVDGSNGVLVERSPQAVREAVALLRSKDQHALRTKARESAEQQSRSVIAQQYLDLFEKLRGHR